MYVFPEYETTSFTEYATRSHAPRQVTPCAPVTPVCPTAPVGPVGPVAPVGAKSRTTFHTSPVQRQVVEPDVNSSLTDGLFGKSMAIELSFLARL